MLRFYARFASRPFSTLRLWTLIVLPLMMSIPLHAQYCSTPYLDCTDDDRVINFSFAGINHSPTCDGSTGYNNFTTSGPTGTAYKTLTYPVSVEVGFSSDQVGAWIDYNHNNVFDASEYTSLGTATSTNLVLMSNITIPATALPGPTRMRIVVYWLYGFSASNGACLTAAYSGDWGEVDDYTINILDTIPPVCVTAPTAPTNNAASICPGATTLSWPAVLGAASYDVYLNAGTAAPTTIVSTSQTGRTYTATVAAGPYTWKVVPKNAYGAATGCAFWNFTVVPPVTPSVTISANPGSNVCVGTPVAFTATPTNGGLAPTYQWKRGTTNVGTGASYNAATVNNGEQYSVVMTSNAACATPATATSNVITMNVIARPTASITATDSSVCQGSTASLQANTGTGLTYQWLRNGAPIAGATAATYDAGVAGSYRVAVSNASCTDTSSATNITIRPLPVATTTVSGPTTFCANTSVTISAVADPSYSYVWLSGGVPVYGETAASFTTNAAGSYTVAVTAEGCTATSAPVTTALLPVPPASVTPAGPVSVCSPATVTLSANSGTGLTYSWRRNGSAIVPAATARTYSATTSGNYEVVVTSTNGCSATSNATSVLISTPPAAAVTVSGGTTFCQGSSSIIRAEQGAGYTYQWYRNGSPIVSGGNTANYTATASGSYYAVVTNGACNTTTATTTITVNPLPNATATATGPTNFCEGGSVMLAANTGTGLSYQWRRNGTPITGATAATYTASLTGFYQVLVSDGNCQGTSNAVNVNVSTMPAPTVSALGATTFCQNASVTLSTGMGAGYQYQWRKDGVDLPGATGPNYVASASGAYSVFVVNGTCSAGSAPEVVSVVPGPPAAINAVGGLNFCQGGQVLLQATRGVGYQYTWYRNGTVMAGQNASAIAASTSGDYTVRVFDGVCDSTSAAARVVVNQMPVVTITLTGGNLLSATTGMAFYQWYRNGSMISGANSATYTATSNGFYAVVASDAIGCSATSAVQQVSSLAIGNSNPAAQVKIYPNPASEFVTVEAALPVQVTLATMDGRVLLEQQAGSMDLRPFADGIYLLRVTDPKTGLLIQATQLTKGIH